MPNWGAVLWERCVPCMLVLYFDIFEFKVLLWLFFLMIFMSSTNLKHFTHKYVRSLSVSVCYIEIKHCVGSFYDGGWLNCIWVWNLFCCAANPHRLILWVCSVLVYTVILNEIILRYWLVEILLYIYLVLESGIFLTCLTENLMIYNMFFFSDALSFCVISLLF